MKIWRQEVCQSNGKIQLTYSRQSMKEIISQGNLIFAYNLRGIGKTTLLNEIAKEKGWKVLNRKTKNGVQRGTSYKLLIDDDIDYNELPDYIKERVVGGFVRYTDISQLKTPKKYEYIRSNNYIQDKDIDILSSLKENAKVLTRKIEESIRKENDGTTKNLINSLGSLLTIIEKYDSNFTLS